MRAPAFSRILSVPVSALILVLTACQPGTDLVRVEVTFDEALSSEPLDGRLILVLSQLPEGEPRSHVTDGVGAQPVFGLDVDGWVPGEAAAFTDTVFGYPVTRLADLPRGSYRAQLDLKPSHRSHSLRQIASRTGGSVYEISSPDEIATAYGEIDQQLRGQYLLGFAAANALSATELDDLLVQVPGSRFSVRTILGRQLQRMD